MAGEGAVNSVAFNLPFPPSVNNLFLNVQGRGRVPTNNYKQWRKDAGKELMVQGVKRVPGPVAVMIDLVAPDKRKRDCDNAIKPILDLLVTMQIIEADDWSVVRSVAAMWNEEGDAPCTVYINSLKAAANDMEAA